jgi:hypothetical protein
MGTGAKITNYPVSSLAARKKFKQIHGKPQKRRTKNRRRLQG